MKPLFLSLSEVAASVALSPATVQNMVPKNLFPPPRRLSAGRVGWLLREIEAWAEERPVSDLPPPPNTGSKKGRREVAPPSASEDAGRPGLPCVEASQTGDILTAAELDLPAIGSHLGDASVHPGVTLSPTGGLGENIVPYRDCC